MRKVVGHIKAVDGISIDLRKGETLGVVGESGSGKTTLGLAMLRLISSEGPIVFMGNDCKASASSRCGPSAATCRSCFRIRTDRFRRAFGCRNHQRRPASPRSCHLRDERDERVIRALNDVGLDPSHALSLSTRIFRRPTATHCGGARPRAGADLRRPRRADQCARHADSGADGRSAARLAKAAKPDLPVHLTRSACGRRTGEPPRW